MCTVCSQRSGLDLCPSHDQGLKYIFSQICSTLQGPARVEKHLGTNNYRVFWGTDLEKVDNVNVVDLKAYYGPLMPLAASWWWVLYHILINTPPT